MAQSADVSVVARYMFAPAWLALSNAMACRVYRALLIGTIEDHSISSPSQLPTFAFASRVASQTPGGCENVGSAVESLNEQPMQNSEGVEEKLEEDPALEA